MLNLPRVTLCCVDCVNHELALAALHLCVRHCTFARVLFVTDRDYDLDGVDCLRIPPLRSREAYSRFVIKELRARIDTDFVLLVQWDGFVVNPAAWSDDFLEHDYIGARWPFHHDGLTVGNGGFSLRSRKLLDALADPHVTTGPLEDVTICRTFRPYLEATHGIRFAPEAVADRFAFESTTFASYPFGFHGLFNFWMFFRPQELGRFLAMATPAILASEQCLQLARNYLELRREDEARMIVHRMLEVPAAAEPARALLARLDVAGSTAVTPSAPLSAQHAPGAGRNDPCPCGSGKRFKACHGSFGNSAS